MTEPVIVFFVDRAIGQNLVPSALRAGGANIERHVDHFAPDAPDVEWLAAVSQNKWVVLTKDEMIGRNPLEVRAIARANARVFILVSGKLTSQQMADIFVNALQRIENFVHGNQAPFIAKIYKGGRIILWKNHAQLLKMLKH